MTQKFVRKGKTKDVYKLAGGNYLLIFKDTVTGHSSGESDPGGNSVVGEVKGVGSGALKLTTYYFELLKSKKVPTHWISTDINAGSMIVKPAKMFGNGLEFVCRYVSTGSFMRRFGMYAKEGQPLNALFEVTLKDDAANDPPATQDTLIQLKLMTKSQYEQAERMCKKICGIVRNDLAKKGMVLYDIKLEFGLIDGKVTLIDEISGGNMRVYKNGKKLDYLQLTELALS